MYSRKAKAERILPCSVFKCKSWTSDRDPIRRRQVCVISALSR